MLTKFTLWVKGNKQDSRLRPISVGYILGKITKRRATRHVHHHFLYQTIWFSEIPSHIGWQLREKAQR